MRLSIFTILLLMVQSSIIHADIDIDAQIEMIRQAPQSQRYQLVNELKQQIAQMNANQQARAIAKYQEETLNAQQTMDPNPENIVNQANQQVIKNQIQQEQEHQIIIPPVEKENINNNIEKIIPEQKQQDPTNTPTDSMPIDNTPKTKPDFSDVQDTFIPEHGNGVPDIEDQNPVKDISDDIREQFPNPIQDVEDNVIEKIQQPVQDITDNIKENIPNTDIQQPEVIKNIPKKINPIQKQPINTKPSFPNSSTKRGF